MEQNKTKTKKNQKQTKRQTKKKPKTIINHKKKTYLDNQ
jgi:hypothetical protein